MIALDKGPFGTGSCPISHYTRDGVIILAQVSFGKAVYLRTHSSTRLSVREARNFWFFTSPWILGFIFLSGGPIIASLVLSFTNYSITAPPAWVGIQSYANLLTDPIYIKSIGVTLTYTFLSVPLSLTFALAVAVLLSQDIRFLGVFRTIFYLPAVISGVAVSLLWEWVLNPQFGLANYVLSWFGIHGLLWFEGNHSVILAFVIMSIWAMGGQMVILLAALNSVPKVLYEAAEIDGASPWKRFLHITLPMISPSILFNLITGMIASFQVFVPAQVITQGGPNFNSEFYVLYLFNNAFQYFRMGYASAQAWVLFVLIMILTVVLLTISKRYVYYEE